MVAQFSSLDILDFDSKISTFLIYMNKYADIKTHKRSNTQITHRDNYLQSATFSPTRPTSYH
jgi:hypothetical protein